MRTTFYGVCEHCGAHLDPGERCDCKKITASEGKKKGTPGGRKTKYYTCIVTQRGVFVNGLLK